MVFIIALVLLFTTFMLSYSRFKKETYKTEKERVKSLQVFLLSWFLVVVTAAAVYFAICFFTGSEFLPIV